MTATEVARNFSEVLDQVQHGQQISIIRGKSEIARLVPNPDISPNGGALQKAISKFLKANEDFVNHPDDTWLRIEAFENQSNNYEDADSRYARIMQEPATDE